MIRTNGVARKSATVSNVVIGGGKGKLRCARRMPSYWCTGKVEEK